MKNMDIYEIFLDVVKITLEEDADKDVWYIPSDNRLFINNLLSKDLMMRQLLEVPTEYPGVIDLLK